MKRLFYTGLTLLALAGCSSQPIKVQEIKPGSIEDKIEATFEEPSNKGEYPGLVNNYRSVIELSKVKQVLDEIIASRLHNPPFSSDNPRIEIIMGDTPVYAEFTKGVTSVYHERLDNLDIKIIISPEELNEILKYDDLKTGIKESYSNKKIKVELIANPIILILKGYLELDKSLSEK